MMHDRVAAIGANLRVRPHPLRRSRMIRRISSMSDSTSSLASTGDSLLKCAGGSHIGAKYIQLFKHADLTTTEIALKQDLYHASVCRLHPKGILIGQSISHYRILRRLGAGGMGEVFEALDTDLHRKVAVKILPGNLAAKPDILERFKREARAVAALNHPNIITIHSVEQADETHFLTMECAAVVERAETGAAGTLHVASMRPGHGLEGRQHLEALLIQPGAQAPTRAADDALRIRISLENLADLAAVEGDTGLATNVSVEPERVVQLLASAGALRDRTGIVVPSATARRHEKSLAEARLLLGDVRFATAWSEGRAMSLSQAAAYTLGPAATTD